MADVLRDWLVERFPSKQAESPMEELFWAGWEMMKPHALIPPEAFLVVCPQAEIERYRADFLFQIKDESGKYQNLVVEVDGHDFHERTKSQAAHDKSRDRWMTSNGYQVMRFTGSEIWANPLQCAVEVADRLYQMRYGRSRRESRARAGLEAIKALLDL